tara:strand:+ start:573 stop:734 length:162 start_codon:yes stop_codon:yes gene_type:complete
MLDETTYENLVSYRDALLGVPFDNEEDREFFEALEVLINYHVNNCNKLRQGID